MALAIALLDTNGRGFNRHGRFDIETLGRLPIDQGRIFGAIFVDIHIRSRHGNRSEVFGIGRSGIGKIIGFFELDLIFQISLRLIGQAEVSNIFSGLIEGGIGRSKTGSVIIVSYDFGLTTTQIGRIYRNRFGDFPTKFETAFDRMAIQINMFGGDIRIDPARIILVK